MAKAKRRRTVETIDEDEAGLSDDERQLRKDRRKWHAPVYDHFLPAVIEKDDKGEKVYFNGKDLNYVFWCKR